MTIENFTGYTEVDPGTQISTSSSRVTYTALSRAADAYIYYDFGAGYFSGRAYLEGTYLISAGTGASPKSASIGFSDTVNDGNATTNQVGAYHWLDGTNAIVQDYVYLRESSAYAGATISPTLSLNTNYYYRTGFLSSLGQYGGGFTQVFSDSGLTTLIASGAKARAAAINYQYVIASQGYTTGGAMTISGYDENVTVFQPTAGIDLTTGVETDTGTGRLVVCADCIVATALNIANSETAKHVAIDEGAGFFGDYKVSGVLNVTAFTNGTVGQMFDILAVTDAAADAGVANDLQGISIYYATASTYKPYIHQAVGGSDSFSTVGPTLNTNQPYSFTLERSGTTLTLKVWNDLVLDANFEGTSQVGTTVTWTGRATTTYRYLLPVTSYLNGATSRSSTFTLGGVRIYEATTLTAETGAFSLSGIAVGLTKTNILSATTASYSLSGIAVGLTHTFPSLTAGTGAFSLSGIAVTLTQGTLRLTAEVGAFGVSLKAADLLYVNHLFVDVKAFTLTGGAVSFVYNRNLPTVVGEFSLAGLATAFRKTLGIAADVGAFSLSGQVAGLSTTMALLEKVGWRLITAAGVPITSASPSPKITISRMSDGAIYDWADATFKLAGLTTPDGDMIETNPTYLPGAYEKSISVNGFDGRYTIYGKYLGTPSQYSSPIEMELADGVLWSTVVTDNLGLVVGYTDTLEASMARVSAAITNKHVLNPADGTVKVYDDAGALLYSGLAYSDAAGTVLYDGTAAVHHTTRLA